MARKVSKKLEEFQYSKSPATKKTLKKYNIKIVLEYFQEFTPVEFMIQLFKFY